MVNFLKNKRAQGFILDRGENIVKTWKPALASFYLFLVSGAVAPLFAWMGLFACPSREMVLFFTVAVAYGLGCWSIACVLQNAYRYVLTNKRVRAEFRFLRTWSRDAPLRAVTDVSTHQDAAGRSLNFGTVAISTAGTSFPGVIFKGVADPHEVESLIIKNISRMRSRR